MKINLQNFYEMNESKAFSEVLRKLIEECQKKFDDNFTDKEDFANSVLFHTVIAPKLRKYVESSPTVLYHIGDAETEEPDGFMSLSAYDSFGIKDAWQKAPFMILDREFSRTRDVHTSVPLKYLCKDSLHLKPPVRLVHGTLEEKIFPIIRQGTQTYWKRTLELLAPKRAGPISSG